MKGCSYLSIDRVNVNRLLSFENPPGLVGEPTDGQDFSFMLPAKSRAKGMMLLDVTYRQPQSQVDPFILFDRNGRIIHIWAEDYTPSPTEIRKIAERLACKRV